MEYILFLSLVSLFSSYHITKWWISVARSQGLVGKDMNKPEGLEVAEGGGIAVVFSIFISYMLLAFYETFILQSSPIIPIVITLVISLATLIGFIDNILGWKKGLKQWQKPILTFIVAVPLMVMNAGVHTMSIPFLGAVDLGLIYPLILIPLGVVGASNGFNMVAGYNGLEAGMGAVILSTFFVKFLFIGNLELAALSLISVGALLGFLVWNWYPAKVFPGDSLTYPIGALIAALAIYGNIELIAFILFIPYFIDAILYFKARLEGRGDVQAFAKVTKDTLLPPYDKFYDTTHISLWLQNKFAKRATEEGVTLSLIMFESILAFFVLYL